MKPPDRILAYFAACEQAAASSSTVHSPVRPPSVVDPAEGWHGGPCALSLGSIDGRWWMVDKDRAG